MEKEIKPPFMVVFSCLKKLNTLLFNFDKLLYINNLKFCYGIKKKMC